MIKVRKSSDRGQFDFGWLKTQHSFSFGEYYDENFMGFSVLRVINEDYVLGGQGFDTHPHRDMEIITYVLEGELQHRDSMGNGSIIRPGEVQRMTAGRGITHSEHNHSKTETLHLLQIWILPEKKSLEPSYEQKPIQLKATDLCLIASRDGRENSVTVHQDISLYAANWSAGVKLTLPLGPRRSGWVQLVSGGLSVAGQLLEAGDGVAISEPKAITLEALKPSTHFLFFDLPELRN